MDDFSRQNSKRRTEASNVPTLDDDEVLSVSSCIDTCNRVRTDDDESLSIDSEKYYRMAVDEHPLALIETDDRIKYGHSQPKLVFEESCIFEPGEPPTQAIISTPIDALREKLRKIERKISTTPNADDSRSSRRGSPGLKNTSQLSAYPRYPTRRFSTGDRPIDRISNLIDSQTRSYSIIVARRHDSVTNHSIDKPPPDLLLHMAPGVYSHPIQDHRESKNGNQSGHYHTHDTAIRAHSTKELRQESLSDDDIARKPSEFPLAQRKASTCDHTTTPNQQAQTVGLRKDSINSASTINSDFTRISVSHSYQIKKSNGENENGNHHGNGQVEVLNNHSRQIRKYNSEVKSTDRSNMIDSTKTMRKARSVVYHNRDFPNDSKTNDIEANSSKSGSTFVRLKTSFNEGDELEPRQPPINTPLSKYGAFSINANRDAAQLKKDKGVTRHSNSTAAISKLNKTTKQLFHNSNESQPGAYSVTVTDEKPVQHRKINGGGTSLNPQPSVKDDKNLESLSDDENSTRPGAYSSVTKDDVRLRKIKRAERRASANLGMVKPQQSKPKRADSSMVDQRLRSKSAAYSTSRHDRINSQVQKKEKQGSVERTTIQVALSDDEQIATRPGAYSIQGTDAPQAQKQNGKSPLRAMIRGENNQSIVVSDESTSKHSGQGFSKRNLISMETHPQHSKGQSDVDADADDEKSNLTDEESPSLGPGAYPLLSEELVRRQKMKVAGRRSIARNSSLSPPSNTDQEMKKMQYTGEKVINPQSPKHLRILERNDKVTVTTQKEARSPSLAPGVYEVIPTEVGNSRLRKGGAGNTAKGIVTSSGDETGLSYAPSTDEEEGDISIQRRRVNREKGERVKTMLPRWVNPSNTSSSHEETMKIDHLRESGGEMYRVRAKSTIEQELRKTKAMDWVDPFREPSQELPVVESRANLDHRRFFGQIPRRYIDRDDEQRTQQVINAPVSHMPSEVASLSSSVTFHEESKQIDGTRHCCAYFCAMLLVTGVILGFVIWLNVRAQKQVTHAQPTEPPTQFILLTEWVQLVDICYSRDTIEVGLIDDTILELGRNISQALHLTSQISLESNIGCLPNNLAVLAMAMGQVSSVDSHLIPKNKSTIIVQAGAEAAANSTSAIISKPSDQKELWLRYILSVFFFATMGQHWKDSEKWLTDAEPCTWYGIACDGDMNVTELSLGGQGNIGGTFPVELFQLTELRILRFEKNGLTGTIPSDLAMLSKIEILDISASKLNGIIPKELIFLTRLQEFRAGGFTMKSPMPKWETLTDLRVLDLRGDNFRTHFPTGLTLLTNLVELTLDGGLSGTLPASIWTLPKLERLELDHHPFLTGEIPGDAFSNQTALHTIYIDTTGIAGSLPTSVGDLSNIETFHLSGNSRVSGSLPSELGKCTKLKTIKVEANLLTGTIPPEIGLLVDLEVLNLRSNLFVGEIPNELGNLPHIREINLSEQHSGMDFFSGTIPQGLCNITSLMLILNCRSSVLSACPQDCCSCFG